MISGVEGLANLLVDWDVLGFALGDVVCIMYIVRSSYLHDGKKLGGRQYFLARYTPLE
jgi:hypothetical protein